jgi:hypothetical protein
MPILKHDWHDAVENKFIKFELLRDRFIRKKHPPYSKLNRLIPSAASAITEGPL